MAIIGKVADGYITDRGDVIPPVEHYMEQKRISEELKEPSDKELIALGKQHHPYYQRELHIDNMDNNIAEIVAFEKSDTEQKAKLEAYDKLSKAEK